MDLIQQNSPHVLNQNVVADVDEEQPKTLKLFLRASTASVFGLFLTQALLLNGASRLRFALLILNRIWQDPGHLPSGLYLLVCDAVDDWRIRSTLQDTSPSGFNLLTELI